MNRKRTEYQRKYKRRQRTNPKFRKLEQAREKIRRQKPDIKAKIQAAAKVYRARRRELFRDRYRNDPVFREKVLEKTRARRRKLRLRYIKKQEQSSSGDRSPSASRPV